MLPLSGRAFDVLEYLVRHHERVVGKEELLSAVWPRVVVEENNLTQAVSAIRRALDDSRETSQYVATVPGRGYRFVAPLQEDIPKVPAPPPPQSSSPSAWYRRRPPGYAAGAAGVALLLVVVLSMVALRREPIPHAMREAPPRTVSERPTIAVLPFRAGSTAEGVDVLAQSVTDVVRNRLAPFGDAVVIGSPSTLSLTDTRLGARDIGAKLRARYLLQGRVERAGEALRIDAELIDTRSASGLWSASFSPVTNIGATAQALVQRVAGTLRIDGAPARKDVPVNLEAYELYLRGQELTSNLRADDNDRAIELFRRATILDPTFARGYLALGQAQLQAVRLRRASVRGHLARGQAQLPASGGAATEQLIEARQALGRALELDPGLGEVWIERAGFESDSAKADELYRRGLQLAPNYGAGYLRYSEFLFDNYRKGEAIEMIDRARQIDPLTPSLHLRKAYMLMVSRSDVEGHEFEASLVEIAQYQRQRPRAAALANRRPAEQWTLGPIAPMAEAVRDEALLTGDYASALELLESQYAMGVPKGAGVRMWSRGLGLVYAHTLILAGQAQRGRELARAILVQIDSESVGRTKDWFSRERAAAYAVLGDDERTVAELQASARTHKYYRWWYVAECDPLYEHLRGDPRFQALAEKAQQHRRSQRALLEELRRKGEVPTRIS